MGALTWDNTGEHFYETGVSKGVLYVQKITTSGSGKVYGWDNGVAWNGLRTVSETPDGGDEEAFWADNTKYLSLRGVENFGGTIGAYQSPAEFDQCDGTVSIMADSETEALRGLGISIGQQTRKPFCFAYVTQKGNDEEGNDYGYIIHIIYNATASPSEREYNTINDSPEPNELSWDFTTTPIAVTGHKPTSIVKIDSTTFTGANAGLLRKIERALFGFDGQGTQGEQDYIPPNEPTLLTPDEIIALITTD